MNRRTAVLLLAAVLVGGFALAAGLYRWYAAERAERTVAASPSLVVRASAKTLGPADAKVHIVEFMDPACETCRAFHPFVQQLVERHRGKVKASIRYLPLHPGADTVVRILEAADAQGRYWETLHLLYETQPVWASHHEPRPDAIWPLLPRIGLDVEAIRRDMQSREIDAILQRDLADARALGLRQTPSFFVDGEPLRTFGYEPLQRMVDEAVARSD